MDGTGLGNLQEAMKVIFAEPLVNNTVSDSEVLDWFDTDQNIAEDKTTGGRYIENAHKWRLSGGVGARSERDYVPQADPPKYVNSRIYLRKIQAVCQMTGDTMRRVVRGEGAWITYLEEELPGVKERLVNEIDRMVLGFGSAVKARVAATTATIAGVAFTNGVSAMDTPATGQFMVAIDRPMGVTGWTQAWVQFLEGERVVFTTQIATAPITLKNAGTAQSGLVLNIDEDNNLLTLEGTAALRAAIAANDYIGNGDGAGTSFGDGTTGAPTPREPQGLLAGIDDGGVLGTYMNVARSGNRLWNSLVFDATTASNGDYGGVMTEDFLQWVDDEVSTRGLGKLSGILLNRSTNRGYWKSLKGDRAFIDPRGNYEGGLNRKGLMIRLSDRAVPLRVARKLPPEVSFGIQRETWKRYTLGKFEWDDTTGAMWNRVTDATGRKDEYYAVGNLYEEYFCNAPRKNVRMQGFQKIN